MPSTTRYSGVGWGSDDDIYTGHKDGRQVDDGSTFLHETGVDAQQVAAERVLSANKALFPSIDKPPASTRTVKIGKRVFEVPIYPDLSQEVHDGLVGYDVTNRNGGVKGEDSEISQGKPIQPKHVEHHVQASPPSEIIVHRIRRRPKKIRKPPSIISLPMSSTTALSCYTAVSSASTIRPTRSKLSLFMNSFIMFGREFCYAIEAGLTTPVLLSIGLPDNLYSLVWVISPILGFILQPIVGSLSDKCRTRWGRRRPFILVLALLLLFGMTFFLNGEHIIKAIFPDNGSDISSNVLLTILLTVFGVVVFDFSADFIEGPIRAYVMDVCNEEDVRVGLFYQAVFTGLGGAFGYASGGVSWVRDTELGIFFPSDRQVVFVFAALIFIICLVMNLTSIAEKDRSTRSKVKRQTKKRAVEPRNRDRNGREFSKYSRVDENQNDVIEGKGFEVESYQDSKPANLKVHRSVSKLQRGRETTGQHVNRKKSRRQDRPKKLPNVEYGTFDPYALTNNNESVNRYQDYKYMEPQREMNHTAKWVNSGGLRTGFANGDETGKYHSHEVIGPYAKHARRSTRRRDADSDSTTSTSDSSSSSSLPALESGPYKQNKRRQTKRKSRQLQTYRSKKEAKSGKHKPVEFEPSSSSTLIQEDKTDTAGEPAHGIKQIIKSITAMPRELKCLCVAHLLGWMSFLCVVLFFTDYVGQEVYGGDPHAPPNSVEREAYKKGVEMGSWGMTINAAASCVYCFLLKPVISRFGARVMYVFGYFAFCVGSLGMALLKNPYGVLGLSSLIGVMSGTLYTLPYFLVAQYHEGYKSLKGTSEERGVGADCALVTCMIQLAQIIVGLGIGSLVVWLDTVTVTVAAGSLISFLGTIWVTFWVKY